MSENTKNENEIVILDDLNNPIIEGMEITIPSDIAELNGAFEEDAHDEE